MCNKIDCESSPLRTASTPEMAPIPTSAGSTASVPSAVPAEQVDGTEGQCTDRDRPVGPHAGEQRAQQQAAEDEFLEDRGEEPGRDHDDGELRPGGVEQVVDHALVLVDEMPQRQHEQAEPDGADGAERQAHQSRSRTHSPRSRRGEPVARRRQYHQTRMP